MMKNTFYSFGCITFLLLFSCSVVAEVVLEAVQLTKRERITRTDFRYEFDVTVSNAGTALQNIQAIVSSINPASDLSQTNLFLDRLDANSQANLMGKLVLIQNRQVRFKASDLIWRFNYEEAQTLNPIEQSFASDSAYITGEHNNYFVERGIANPDEVDQKIQSTYEQLFELIPALPSSGNNDPLIEVFSDTFDMGTTNWNANADNGTSPSVSISSQNGRLVVQPTWNATGDAIALKYQQFTPSDFSHGARISYKMEAAAAYAADGNLAVQLILEDENYNPAFFSFRFVNQSSEQTFVIENVGPDSSYGFISENFDFSKVAGIGFQFLANNKAPEIGGDILLDDISISVNPPPDEALVVFEDVFENDIDNWNTNIDNGSVTLALSLVDQALQITPVWDSPSDAFTIKYQQFEAVNIVQGASINFDVQLPSQYVENGNMAIQLVIEDANYQPGYIGYANVESLSSDGFVTLKYENIGPNASYGYVSDSFDFTRLAGVGLQFVANGKAADVTGDIVIDNVTVSTNSVETTPAHISSNTSVLYGTSDDLAFIKSIDSDDIRSEGMSYGMMVAVMMDDKQTFDKLWMFTKQYMQNKEGDMKDFFAWRLNANPPYNVLDHNPAPDGEEYFAMSLFFANNRWGSGDGVFNYRAEANKILVDMVFTKTENTRLMMNPDYQQIEFLTSFDVESFTDPSYHLPAFYELWALWADQNNQYWHEAAQISRSFLDKAGHPITGLFSEYASHEGEPQVTTFNPLSAKSAFDSYRVIGNLAMDYHWISKSAILRDIIDRQVSFFESEINTFGNFIAVYELDGTREPGVNYRGEGRNAMLGYGSTASELPFSTNLLQSLWDQNPPTGEFRYYDGLLYMKSLLHASGKFKIYKPEEVSGTTDN